MTDLVFKITQAPLLGRIEVSDASHIEATHAYHCFLKLARTIAYLAVAENIGSSHLAEAMFRIGLGLSINVLSIEYKFM